MMSAVARRPSPFRTIPLESEVQKKIADNFLGYPNGLMSCNHWGHKLSATVTPQELDDLYNYPLDPSDIWVVTPPKCGTTWAQEMVWLIANNLDYETAKALLSTDRWSFLDLDVMSDKQYMASVTLPQDLNQGPQVDDVQPSPRFVKSHLPMSMNNPRLLDTCKVVYVARNPKDACVSFYHHSRLVRRFGFTGDFETFVNLFMDSHVVATPLIEHMIEAWNLRHHPNMCFLFFEDMKRDLSTQIRKVAEFLDKSYPEEEVEKLADHLHFDNLKNNPSVNYKDERVIRGFYTDRGDFMRKGKTGDWKNYFTPEMSEVFDKWMTEKLKGSDISFVMDLQSQD